MNVINKNEKNIDQSSDLDSVKGRNNEIVIDRTMSCLL